MHCQPHTRRRMGCAHSSQNRNSELESSTTPRNHLPAPRSPHWEPLDNGKLLLQFQDLNRAVLEFCDAAIPLSAFKSFIRDQLSALPDHCDVDIAVSQAVADFELNCKRVFEFASADYRVQVGSRDWTIREHNIKRGLLTVAG